MLYYGYTADLIPLPMAARILPSMNHFEAMIMLRAFQEGGITMVRSGQKTSIEIKYGMGLVQRGLLDLQADTLTPACWILTREGHSCLIDYGLVQETPPNPEMPTPL